MATYHDEPTQAERLEDVLGNLANRKVAICDLEDVLEDLIPAKPAAKILDWHVATFYRACFDGMGPKKRRLRFVKRGRQTCSTKGWIAEFLEGLTADRLEGSTSSEPALAVRTPNRRRREIDRADRELRARGI